MRLSVWLSADETGDTWDNVGLRPIHKSIAVNGGDFKYVHSEFNINKPHKRLRIGVGYKIDQNYGESIAAEDWSKIFKGFYVWDSGDKPLSFKTKNDFYIKTDYPVEDGINTTFTYAIQDSWQQSRDNNHITCVIKIGDTEYRLQEELRFGPKGSNGTNITFLLEKLEGKNALTYTDAKDDTLSIEALLIDNNGQYINIDKNKLSWEIFNNKYFKTIEDENLADNVIKLGFVDNCDYSNVNTRFIDNYAILSASYRGAGDNLPTLQAFLPLPIKTANCVSMTGASQVIYNN
jgi:hypothetical protein